MVCWCKQGHGGVILGGLAMLDSVYVRDCGPARLYWGWEYLYYTASYDNIIMCNPNTR